MALKSEIMCKELWTSGILFITTVATCICINRAGEAIGCYHDNELCIYVSPTCSNGTAIQITDLKWYTKPNCTTVKENCTRCCDYSPQDTSDSVFHADTFYIYNACQSHVTCDPYTNLTHPNGFQNGYLFIVYTCIQATTTTEAITTTQPGDSITLPVWIIYAIIFSILGVAAVVGLIFLYRWICNKTRHVSVLPKNETVNTRITNDLNNENTEHKEIFDSFLVSHECKNISKKTRKSVNCSPEKDKTSVETVAIPPEITIFNNVIDSIIENRKKREELLQDDAVSENAFNHQKEESVPKDVLRLSRENIIATRHSNSMKSTFKSEIYNEGTPSIPRGIILPYTNRNPTTFIRKERQSTMKRNMKIIKSKLTRQLPNSSDEATTSDSSITSDYTSDEEESEIDPSFVQSEEEDFITDDEDSVDGNIFQRNAIYSKKKKKHREFAKKTRRISHMPIGRSKNENKSQKITAEYQPNCVVIPHIRRNNMTVTKSETKQIETQKQESCKCTEQVENNPRLSTTLSSAVKLGRSISFDEPKVFQNNNMEEFDNISKPNTKKTEEIFLHETIPRHGPVATSSFKSTNENDTENKGQPNVKQDEKRQQSATETKKQNKIGVNGLPDLNDGVQQIEKENVNYKQFQDIVLRRGKVDLNRSVSLNETERNKDEMNSRRRKRRYQSLRHARLESVFHVVQKLDTVPKKSILKKSKSLCVKKNAWNQTSKDITDTKECVSEVYETAKDTDKSVILQDTRNFTQGTVANEYDLSRSKSVKMQPNEERPSLSCRSRTPDPFRESNANVFKENNEINIKDQNVKNYSGETQRQKRDQTHESKLKGSATVQLSTIPNDHSPKLHSYHSDNASEIMSSNIAVTSIDTRTTETDTGATKDKKAFEVAHDRLTITFGVQSTPEIFVLDKLSPILHKKVTKTSYEANTRNNARVHIPHQDQTQTSSSDTESETGIIIGTKCVVFDPRRQANTREKLKTNRESASFIDYSLTKNTTVNHVNDIEKVTFPTEPLSQMIPDKNIGQFKSESNVNEQSKGMFGTTEAGMIRDNDKTTCDGEALNNIRNTTKTRVSECGLVHHSTHEPGFSNSTSFETCVHATDKTTSLKHSDTSSLEAEQYKTSAAYMSERSQTPPVQTERSKTPLFQNDHVKYPSLQNTLMNTLSFQEEQPKTPIQSDQAKTPTFQNQCLIIPSFQTELNQTPSNKMVVSTMSSVWLQHTNAPLLQTDSRATPALVSEGQKTLFADRPKSPNMVAERQGNSLYLEHDHCELEATSSNEQQYNSSNISMKHLEKAEFSLASIDYPNNKVFPSGLSKIPAIPIEKLRNSELTEEQLKSKMNSDMYKKQQANKHGLAKSFILKNTETNKLARSKSPSVEMQSSEKYFIEPKRSKTPTPEPTFCRHNTDKSFMRTLVSELNPKHQRLPLPTFHRHTTDVAHVESFSRNVNAFSKGTRHPEFREHRSATRLDPKSRVVPGTVRCKTPVHIKSDIKTLLIRREKDDNTLTGRSDSRKYSERERPKSAMSLRSAPLSTTHESVLEFHGRTGAIHGTFKQRREKSIHQSFNSGKMRGKKQHYPPEISDNGRSMSTGSGENVYISGTKLNKADSDSEIEQFFANPNAEILQFNNKDTCTTYC